MAEGDTFSAVAVGKTSVKVYADQKRATPAENTMLNDDEDDEDDEDPKSFAELVEENAFAIETFLYLIFLVLFTSYAVLAQGNSNDAYAMGESIRRIYLPFKSVTDASSWFAMMKIKAADREHVFAFMMGPFINATFPMEWYNGDAMSIDELVLIPTCEAIFSKIREDQAAYGPEIVGKGEREFKFLDQSEFGCSGTGCSFVGPSSGIVYPGSGYVKQLATVGEVKSRSAAVTLINQLSDSLFIDRYTSAVFVESVLYDSNRHAIALVRLSLELPPSGLVFTTIQVVGIPVEMLYPREGDGGYIALEAFVLIGVILFSIKELTRWNTSGTRMYWGSAWAWIDWTNYIIFYVCFSLRYGSLQQAALLKFPPAPTDYIGYWGPAGTIKQWRNLLGINAIFTWLKIFKYLYRMPFLQDMLGLLYTVAEDAVWLMVLGLCIIFGFSIAFVLNYGDLLATHSTLGTSMVSLYNLMIGNVSGQASSPDGSEGFLGPFFTITFTLLTTLLLLNMFVAILVKGITQVEASPSVFTIIRRNLHNPRVKKRIARMSEFAERVSCGLCSSGVPDATEDIVEELRSRPAGPGCDNTDAAGGDGGGVSGGVGTVDGAALKRIEGKLAHDMDLSLQCLLQLSKEVRSLSHRIKHLTETAAEPAVFS